MVTASSLKEQFDTKAAEIESLGASVNEDKASQRPGEGEWCVRDVLCHLSGDAQHTFRDDLDRFLEQDKPELDVAPGDLYWTSEREKMSVSELAKSTADQYREIGALVAGLSSEQLARPARIAFLKQARGNDEIALSEWVSLIANYHLEQHLGQLRELTR